MTQKPQELTNEWLHRLRADDRARTQPDMSREKNAILKVCAEHTQPAVSTTYDEAKAEVSQLLRLIDDAKRRHHATFEGLSGYTTGSEAGQKSMQAIDRLRGQLDLAQSRVTNLELAEKSRNPTQPSAA